MTRPDPRDFENLLIRPDPTRPDPTRPDRLEMPMVDGDAGAFARRSAVLRLSVSSYQFHMNNSAPSSTRRHHLPAF